MPPEYNAFDWPSEFRGTAQSVKRKAKRMFRDAWQHQSWDAVLSWIALEDVTRTDCDICLRRHRLLSSNATVWRLYMLADQLKDHCRTVFNTENISSEEVDAFDHKYVSFIGDGMKHLWFTAGMLEPNGIFGTGSRHCAQVGFAWFVYWLPELSNLQLRLTVDLPSTLQRSFGLETVGWASRICQIACNFGCEINALNISDDYGGDVISALLGEGVIERDCDRYRPITFSA